MSSRETGQTKRLISTHCSSSKTKKPTRRCRRRTHWGTHQRRRLRTLEGVIGRRATARRLQCRVRTSRRGDIYASSGTACRHRPRYGGGRARIDQQQNIVFRWVRTESLYDVYLALKEIGMATSGRETIRDIVTCPGTDSCKLGITSSMGLTKRSAKNWTRWTSQIKVFPRFTSRRADARTLAANTTSRTSVPRRSDEGRWRASPGLRVVHRRRVDRWSRTGWQSRPRTRAGETSAEALEMIIDHYKANRNEGEEFNKFVDRVGTLLTRTCLLLGRLKSGRSSAKTSTRIWTGARPCSINWSAAKASAQSEAPLVF